MNRVRVGVAAVVGVLTVTALLTACGSGSGGTAPTTPARTGASRPSPSVPPSSVPPSATASPGPTVAVDRATQVLASLDLRAQAGQLVMTGLRLGDDDGPTFDALREHGVGNVFLGGRSSVGVTAVADLTGRLQAAAPGGVPLLVGTDQEGGQVQVLSGPGFDTLPSGVDQGRMTPAALTAAATRWGRQLAAAGVRVDLAPVLDTVDRDTDNPPIGDYDREYGHDPATVAAGGGAFAAGLAAGGIGATAKHFPGLGRVTANTDTSAEVTDDVTTADDAALQPFRDAVAAGVPVVMVSSAVYSRIDPDRQACYSPTVVTDLLRGALGFGGVVVTDDVGNAKAVSGVPVGERATRFVDVGGDLVLDVDPGHAGDLVDALVTRAQADPAFAAKVQASALRVLQLKARLGLLA